MSQPALFSGDEPPAPWECDVLNPGSPVEEVKVDPQRQHISLVVDRKAEGAFVDLGPVLHWWAYSPLELDAAGARELGEALVAWADRKESRPS